ncbi:hypothetical protein CXB51_026058 [Gossypium anomalum]|uniref:Zinc knuckle CX2CX4HX4C domain-containing protein n=1 Tax=Gossypium anomalum TaxID=47600 RepID=A0A8J6CQU8_9ROSI|nr:hypothetical protein CXB51_026058 [Gossypium anomalum]
MEREFAELTLDEEEEEAVLQIHDIPIGFFSKNLARQLGDFLGQFLEYDSSDLGKARRNFMRIRVQLDVRQSLKRKKQVSFAGNCSNIIFKYEMLALFCFYCGRLGHSDSCCEAKMWLRVEVAVMGWDLSLRAQSKRAFTMNSIWLREDGEDETDASLITRRNLENRPWGVRTKSEIKVSIDPVLGINLEGICPSSSQWGENLMAKQTNSTMEHDLEERVLIREERKKRHRGESADQTIREECDIATARSRRLLENNLLSPVAVKRPSDRSQ